MLPVLRYSEIDTLSDARTIPITVWADGLVAQPDRALRWPRLDTGTVWINQHLDLPPDIAFAGAKQSGIGVEMGMEGLEEFTQAKIINMAK